ncbi:glycosyltransferase family 4 protein [Enterovibrio calviensis]|uniref:glycosyltransferase family 4 protein n=1 Tax=Enterovibrio calviensis TaxID=91359 RepID=UPI00047FA09C|nr:glycosyltransferase family 4 protein [Enterovibrio calviensis]
MSKLKHILVLDPIAFSGGSKVSTKHVLTQLEDKNVRVSVLTADTKTWRHTQAFTKALWMPEALEKAEQGAAYFARHVLIALQLLWFRLFIGRIDTALAASGPGVDLGLYFAKLILGYRLVQMIHGPVAKSRTIGRCLLRADNVFYLESTSDSLCTALSAAGCHCTLSELTHFQTFNNGLPKSTWPSQCQYDNAVVFWAASLLKWKGLDTLMDALQRIHSSQRVDTHVCFIRPEQTTLPTSEAPQDVMSVSWHEAPENLDEIRSQSNIFVSTSVKEPFGLSILEAMAAGMCVIIPKDGAYWDSQLTHGVNCLKYQAGDITALAMSLQTAQSDMRSLKRIGKAAGVVAQQYRAEICFRDICEALATNAQPKASAQTRHEVQG